MTNVDYAVLHSKEALSALKKGGGNVDLFMLAAVCTPNASVNTSRHLKT